jgi:hypothetical protein
VPVGHLRAPVQGNILLSKPNRLQRPTVAVGGHAVHARAAVKNSEVEDIVEEHQVIVAGA